MKKCVLLLILFLVALSACSLDANNGMDDEFSYDETALMELFEEYEHVFEGVATRLREDYEFANIYYNNAENKYTYSNSGLDGQHYTGEEETISAILNSYHDESQLSTDIQQLDRLNLFSLTYGDMINFTLKVRGSERYVETICVAWLEDATETGYTELGNNWYCYYSKMYYSS